MPGSEATVASFLVQFEGPSQDDPTAQAERSDQILDRPSPLSLLHVLTARRAKALGYTYRLHVGFYNFRDHVRRGQSLKLI